MRMKLTLKPKIKKKQTKRKSSTLLRRNTKNVDYYRDNLIIISSDSKNHCEAASEFLDCEIIEEETDEEILSEDYSSSETSDTENSEIENGEVYSDTENL
jgi:hypothetical protein